ncbi:hypothetical protein AVEN_162958-1 [Araneus ventricosus]|uniref:Uncharacterized protein n=1 Tax=Araneus ventricosus TaxID=182803 RepID=A0A4Y2C0A4_ARAVE|nr:hypothetical protein AVEN_162958-1 [Araneus ventricosus]
MGRVRSKISLPIGNQLYTTRFSCHLEEWMKPFRKRAFELSCSFQSKHQPSFIKLEITQCNTGHGPFVAYLHRFGLRSHDTCIYGDIIVPEYYAVDWL